MLNERGYMQQIKNILAIVNTYKLYCKKFQTKYLQTSFLNLSLDVFITDLCQLLAPKYRGGGGGGGGGGTRNA